jgi:UDP-glucuronate 4-epimerase
MFMAKILVTGGAGFIGSHVARALLKRGDTVVLLDDFNDRYDPRLKEARVTHLFADTTAPAVIRGDIRERERIDALFAEHAFDHVIHLAAWASVQPSIENPYIYTAVNVDGTVNILEAARKARVKNIIFASSSSVYGGLHDVPIREDADVSHPLSPYAATKAAGEIMCATWNNLYQIPVTCLRFFTVYGPWGRPEMAFFKFTEAISNNQPVQMRGRDTMRDFTYVDDVVQGILGALDNPHDFAIYNLGESDGVPLPRLIAAIEAALNKKAEIQEVPLPAGDIPRTLADITRAKENIGYHPTTSIEEGVAHFVKWYQEWYVPHFGA